MAQDTNTRTQVIEAVKAFPNSSAQTVSELIPGTNNSQIQQMCLALYSAGVFDREKAPKSGAGQPPFLYRLAENPQPRTTIRSSRGTNPLAVLQAREKALTARVAELEQWQAEAMLRYPDLAVSPIVIEARKIVAEQFQARHDTHAAEDVLAGRKDESTIVKAVVAALERAV